MARRNRVAMADAIEAESDPLHGRYLGAALRKARCQAVETVAKCP
jgi:hypothetical protein